MRFISDQHKKSSLWDERCGDSSDTSPAPVPGYGYGYTSTGNKGVAAVTAPPAVTSAVNNTHADLAVTGR